MCGKAEGVWWWVGSLGGFQGQTPEGLQAPRVFGQGTFWGAPFTTVHPRSHLVQDPFVAAHLESPLALLEVPVCVVISHPRLASLLRQVCKVPWYKEPMTSESNTASHLSCAASSVCGHTEHWSGALKNPTC